MTEAVSKERTRNYLHQIKDAVVYRAFAIFASFLTIPLMIHYLGQEQFGVWSTLLTVMSWVMFLDLGVGNGLRNKVAESLSRGEKNEASNYVASGYTLIGLLALAIWILVTVGSYYISWQKVFNTQAITELSLGETVRIAAFFVMMNFWIGLISALLGALQKTSLIALGQMVSNLLVLALVYLSNPTEASISRLALAYGMSLLIANILLSLWFYLRSPELRPRAYFNKRHVRSLLNVGLQFFTIQLAVLVIFTTDKMLITQLFGPEYVTHYDVVFKLFSIITFAHGLISAPLWSAYTDAYHRNDTAWIRSMLRKQLMALGVVAVAILILSISAKPIIKIWIGQELQVSSTLIFVMGLFTFISTWNNVFAMFVNGIGKIQLQLYIAIVAMCMNIPLSIFFAKYTELGLSGIVVGTICSLFLSGVAVPLQVHQLIRRATNDGIK